MVRKSFRVMVCFDLHQVSCPGVWLCPKGKIFITLSLFKCLETTKQIKPFFPLKYHQRFVFDKIFDSLSSLGELENEMGMRNIRMELVQVFKGKQKLVTLGVFQAPLTNVLYPAVAAGSDSGAAEVDLLFEACKPFPGIIAPKAEVSTRVVIEELRLCPKFTDGPVNPTLVSSVIKCGAVKSRQSSVCHQKDNKQCKCNCCCLSGRIILRRPSTSRDIQSPMSKSRRDSTAPHQDTIEGGDDNNSESNGEQCDNYNQTNNKKTTDERTNHGEYDQNDHIYDQTNYQDNIQRRNEGEHVVRNHFQKDGTDHDEYQRNNQNDRQRNDQRQRGYDNISQSEYDIQNGKQRQRNDNQQQRGYDNISQSKYDIQNGKQRQRNDNQQQRSYDNISQSEYDKRQQRENDNQYGKQRQRNDNQQKRGYDNTSQNEYDNRQQREYDNQNGKQRKNNNERNGRTPIQNFNDMDKRRSYSQYNRGENNGRNSPSLNRSSLNSQNGIQKQTVTVDVHVDAIDDSNDHIEPRHSQEILEHRSSENQQRNSRQNNPYEMNQRSVTKRDQEVQINRSTDNTKKTCECGIECATCKKTMESLMVPWKVYAAPPFYNHYCNQSQNMDNPQHRNSESHQNQPNINTANQNGSPYNNHHQQNFNNNDHTENNHQQNLNYNEDGNNQQKFYNQNEFHHQPNSINNQNGSYDQNLNNDRQNIVENNAGFHQVTPPSQSATTQTSSSICRCQERDKFSANVEKQNEKSIYNKTPCRPNTQTKVGNILEKNSKLNKPTLNQQQLRNNQQTRVQNQMMNRQTNPIIKGLNNQCQDQQTNSKEDQRQCQVMEVRFICPCGHVESSIIPQKEDINRGSVQYRNIQTYSVGIPTNNRETTTNKYSKPSSGIPVLTKPTGRINRNSKFVKGQEEEEITKHYPKNYLTCVCPKPKSVRLRKEC